MHCREVARKILRALSRLDERKCDERHPCSKISPGHEKSRSGESFYQRVFAGNRVEDCPVLKELEMMVKYTLR